MVWMWGAFGLYICTAFATDIRKQVIPNWLTIGGMIAGLIGYLVALGWEGLTYSAAGLACGFVPMLLLYLLRGVGAGDVKLFGAIGAMTGAAFALHAMAAALCMAGVIAVIVLAVRSDRAQRFARLNGLLLRVWLLRDWSWLRQLFRWKLAEREHRPQVREQQKSEPQRRHGSEAAIDAGPIDSRLRFPFMWAVVPGVLYTYAVWMDWL
ncbi:prepilin peptidase [Paenibacillus sp. YYML68]|uniref:A24 family peptidase n=1 Tax=Paenibacillus sp. YYML68 TaxID=2909250 RepID=UPI002492538F|nr:A24 family peptidase [Paenibacillus sp. YYML68]